MKVIITCLTISAFLFTGINQMFSDDGSWEDISSNLPVTEWDIAAVYAMGDKLWVSSARNAEVYYSTNSGDSFVIQEVDTSLPAQVFSIAFKNDREGIAVGNSGNIYTTSNGGSEWEYYNSFSGRLYDVKYNPSDELYYATGTRGRVLLIGGPSTIFMETGAGDTTLHSISLTDNMGWICGNSVIRKLSEGIWADGGLYPQAEYTGIDFVSDNTGWACARNGLVIKTGDGVNWSIENTPAISGLNDIKFGNHKYGWACGDNGLIIHTNMAGSNWDLQESGTDENLTRLYFPSAALGYAVGDNGTLLRYTGIVGVDQLLAAKVELFPNPAADRLNISMPESALNKVIIRISDLQGNILIEKENMAAKKTISIDISDLACGFYQCIITTNEGGFINKKLMIK